MKLSEWDMAVIRLSLRRYAESQDTTCERGQITQRGARGLASDLDKFVEAEIEFTSGKD